MERKDIMSIDNKDMNRKSSDRLNDLDDKIDVSYLELIYPRIIKLGDEFYACGSLKNINRLYRQNGEFVCKLYRDSSDIFVDKEIDERTVNKLSNGHGLFGIFNEEFWAVTKDLKSKIHSLYELSLWEFEYNNINNVKSLVYYYDQLGRKIDWNKWNKDIVKPQHVAGTECIKVLNGSGDYIGSMISFSNKPSGESYIFVSIDNEINMICTSEAIRFSRIVNSVVSVDNGHGEVRDIYQIIKKGRDAYRLIIDRKGNEIKIISVEKQDLGLLNGFG